jgi:hypothetical protein
VEAAAEKNEPAETGADYAVDGNDGAIVEPVPFGMSAEEFDRLPAAAQQALRAQTAAVTPVVPFDAGSGETGEEPPETKHRRS